MLKTLNSKPDPNGTYLSPSFPRAIGGQLGTDHDWGQTTVS